MINSKKVAIGFLVLLGWYCLANLSTPLLHWNPDGQEKPGMLVGWAHFDFRTRVSPKPTGLICSLKVSIWSFLLMLDYSNKNEWFPLMHWNPD